VKNVVSSLSSVGKIEEGNIMKRMVKLDKDVVLEIDESKMEWCLSLMDEEGALPAYVIKFITIVAAE